MRMIQEEKAINSFKTGLNCAQAVISAYSDYLNFDDNLALNISCGFGSGMGKLQETCGAVTGSFMVLGIYNSNKYSENKDRKEKTNGMIREFSEKFKLIHGATDCKTLLNCNINTEEGQRFMKDNMLKEKVCEKCISDSVKIIQELIEK